MKKWKYLVSIFVALMMVAAILFATPILGPSVNSEVSALENPDFYLWAGQTIPAGNGQVTNDDDSITFTIDPAAGYPVSYIHVKIWDSIPPSGGQSPPGGFPWHVDYSGDPQSSQFTFVLPDDATNDSPPAFDGSADGSTVYIGLHAVVGIGVYSETAWACASDTPGGCDQFGGTPWAYYFAYTLE